MSDKDPEFRPELRDGGPISFARAYNRPEVVAQYMGDALDNSEGRLLEEVLRRPGELAMLDLGVGAGRTTASFSRLTRSYLGIDIAPGMIDACRERFAARPGCDFRVGDASDLDRLEDSSFDLVLFSFNGIDCLSVARREICLRSIRRVLRPDGVFFFSTHNLQMIPRYFRPPPEGSEDAHALTFERREKIARYNEAPSFYLDRKWTLFWDGVYGDSGQLRHIYIKPAHQLDRLRQIGFRRAHAISTVTGRDLADNALDKIRDLSVAYLCHGGEARGGSHFAIST